MGVGELLLGLVTCLGAFVGSSAPAAAWLRTREPRFLLVLGAYLALLGLGALAVWGAASPGSPAYTHLPLLPLGLVAIVAILLMATGLVPRGR